MLNSTLLSSALKFWPLISSGSGLDCLTGGSFLFGGSGQVGDLSLWLSSAGRAAV